MQKIITDKKPFVTERTEKITITHEAMVHRDMISNFRDLIEPMAKEKNVPEGILPIRQDTSFDAATFTYHWFEVLL